MALVVASLVAGCDGGDRDRVSTGEATSTTAPPGTGGPSTTAAPGGTPAPGDALALWPPSGHAPYTDPARAARSFLEELLGLRNQPLSAFRPGAGSTGEVDVHQVGEGGAVRPERVVATVTLVQVGGHWVVTGARSDDVAVESPSAGDTLGASPVAVTGKGRGFEGTMLVSLLDTAGTAASPLASGYATAGGGGELLPFRVDLPLARGPSRPTGAVVLAADTGCESCNTAFAVVPVRFAPGLTGAAPAAEPATVEVHWVDASGRLARATRVVDRGAGVLRGALLELLRGPYGEERDAGLTSALAEEAGWAPSVSVAIRDGLATVDFAADLPERSPGTSAAAASERLLRQLQATVLQFPTVTRAEYRVGGRCDAFWSWLQRGCTVVDRTNAGI